MLTIPHTHIRKAHFNETGLVSSLIRDSFRDVAVRFGLTRENCPKHPSQCTTDWIKKDHARGVIYYIIESHDREVGCVAFERANQDLCYLERLGVLPEARRKGFGRSMVDHIIRQADLRRMKKISIGIIAADLELKKWYKKIGFVETETRPFDHLPFKVTFMIYEL